MGGASAGGGATAGPGSHRWAAGRANPRRVLDSLGGVPEQTTICNFVSSEDDPKSVVSGCGGGSWPRTEGPGLPLALSCCPQEEGGPKGPRPGLRLPEGHRGVSLRWLLTAAFVPLVPSGPAATRHLAWGCAVPCGWCWPCCGPRRARPQPQECAQAHWTSRKTRTPDGAPGLCRKGPCSDFPGPHASCHPTSSGKFQGEWYVVALAGNIFRKEDRELLNPYTATWELQGHGRIHVSYAMTRGQRCTTWAYVLNPTSQPGIFEVDKSKDPQADSEAIQVADSDYTTFGLMLSKRSSVDGSIFRISLLSRSWTLRPEALDKFVCLVRKYGLSDDQIVFPAVTAWVISPGNC